MRSVAVYCGAREGADPAFAHAVAALGVELAKRGLVTVYGGGSLGLMGVLANAAVGAGGSVIGVIPRGLFELELGHSGLERLEVVETMHERKARMAELADAFIAAPGGFGTLDELFEALTWTQLGIQDKPCGLLSINGYYDRLVDFVGRAAGESFVDEGHSRGLVEADRADLLLDRLFSWESPGPRKEVARER